ncbi:MAG: hypothetical protein WBK08_12270 [Nitrospira sp.]
MTYWERRLVQYRFVAGFLLIAPLIVVAAYLMLLRDRFTVWHDNDAKDKGEKSKKGSGL